MNVIYFGTGEIGRRSVQWLLDAPEVNLRAVVTQPDRAAGRGLKVSVPPVKFLAGSRGVPVLQPPKVRDPRFLRDVAALAPDLIVVMAYGQILPQALLDIPHLGALNLHASLLPRHRGAAPVHAAVLAGDTRSGVTVMWVDAGLDTGDILLARECEVAPDETAGSLHDKLARLAPAALAEAMALVKAGRAPRMPQEESLATYAPKLDRASGRIDWSVRADDVARRIRGLHPWPGSGAEVVLSDGRRLAIKVHRARVADADASGPLVIPCGGGGAVELLELQGAGGRRMGAHEFLRGHRVSAVI